MDGNRPSNRGHDIHGKGVTSLNRGFDEIRMPEHRRAIALEIVLEVLAANGAQNFYWYRTRANEELCCSWDDALQNLLWINTGELHVLNDPIVTRPARGTTYSKADGALVGWLLPGGEAGAGGGRRQPNVATVLCSATFISQPAGTLCPDCEVVHA